MTCKFLGRDLTIFPHLHAANPQICCTCSKHRRRNWRGQGGPGPPQYFTLETLLIFMHAAQIAAIAVYITFGPPKMELLPTPMVNMYLGVNLFCTSSLLISSKLLFCPTLTFCCPYPSFHWEPVLEYSSSSISGNIILPVTLYPAAFLLQT